MECKAVLPDTDLFKGGCKWGDGYPSPLGEVCIFHLQKEHKGGNSDKNGFDVNSIFEKSLNTLLGKTHGVRGWIWNHTKLDMRGFVVPINFVLSPDDYKESFLACDFTGVQFLGDLLIRNMRFVDRFIFHNVTCGGNFIFSNNTFSDEYQLQITDLFCEENFTFVNNQTENSIVFRNLFLKSNFNFTSVGSSPCILDNVNANEIVKFEKGPFNDTLKFINCSFGTPRGKKYFTTFEHVQFNGEVIFSKTNFYGLTNFNNTNFKHTVWFDNCTFENTPSLIGSSFEEGVEFHKTFFETGNEVTFRKIKKIMEDHKNIWGATVFFGKELSQKRKNSSFLQNLADLNFFYWIFNNYGVNWAFPILWLIGSTFGFAFLYNAYSLSTGNYV